MGRFWWACVCGIVFWFGCTAMVSAQSWIGAGVDSNWSTVGNWSGGLVPANDGTADVVMVGPGNLNPIVDLPWNIHSLSFADGAPAFSLSGSDLKLGQIQNIGGTSQTIGNNIVADSNLVLDTAGNTLLGGIISGAGGITKTGGGMVVLGGANTYFGPTVISSGELRANNSAGSATGSGSVTVNLGGTLSGSGSVGGSVSVEEAGTVALAAGPGALQLGSLVLKGSRVQFSFDSGVSHRLNIAGPLDLQSGSMIQLINPPTWQEYNETLIDYSGPALSDDAFNKLNLVFPGRCLADFETLWHDKTNTQIGLLLHMSLGPPSWKRGNISGSWNDPCNWISGHPNGFFYGDSFSSATVTLDGNQSVWELNLNGGSFTIAPPGSLTVTTGRVYVSDGSHSITAPLIFTDNATFEITSGALKVSELSMPASKKIEKTGGGTLTIGGVQSQGASYSLAVSGGRVNLNSNQDLRELTVAFGNAGTQTLDLASPAGAGQFRQIQVFSANLLATKNALYSALINANAAGAADSLDGITDSGLHSGAKIGLALIGDHVTMRPTLVGDLNLDGMVTISDFIDLASNFITFGTATWQEGDLNYDRNVTISDFIDLGSNFNTSYSGESWPISEADAAMLKEFAAAHVVAIPEPARSLLLIFAAGALGRRRAARHN